MAKKIPACVAVLIMAHTFLASAAQASPEVARLIPAPTGFPAPPVFMEILELLTLYLHLVLVNILLGSLILAIVDGRAAASDQKDGVAFMPKILALAVNFAIAPFLFLQVVYGSFVYPSIVIMAVWWVSIFMLVMLAYYGLYVSDGAVSPARRGPVLTLSAVLLLVTAFLLTNVSTLMQSPDRWLLWFSDPYGAVLNLGDPTVFPRYLHILVASVAVGGLGMSWRARWSKGGPGTDPAEADRRVRRGLTWFFYASLAQIPAGLLFLSTLPPDVRGLFLGGDALRTGVLVLALSGLGVALFLARRGRLAAVTVTVLCVILAMVCVRALVREAMLLPYTNAMPSAASSIAMPHGQDGAIVLFLACAILGIGVIVWMGRVLFQTLRRGGGSEMRGG